MQGGRRWFARCGRHAPAAAMGSGGLDAYASQAANAAAAPCAETSARTYCGARGNCDRKRYPRGACRSVAHNLSFQNSYAKLQKPLNKSPAVTSTKASKIKDVRKKHTPLKQHINDRVNAADGK